MSPTTYPCEDSNVIGPIASAPAADVNTRAAQQTSSEAPILPTNRRILISPPCAWVLAAQPPHPRCRRRRCAAGAQVHGCLRQGAVALMSLPPSRTESDG